MHSEVQVVYSALPLFFMNIFLAEKIGRKNKPTSEITGNEMLGKFLYQIWKTQISPIHKLLTHSEFNLYFDNKSGIILALACTWHYLVLCYVPLVSDVVSNHVIGNSSFTVMQLLSFNQGCIIKSVSIC